MSSVEITLQRTGAITVRNEKEKKENRVELDEEETDLDEFSWVTEGAVATPQDQAACGSCYTFATTAVIEAQMFLSTGKLVPLSEQNLKDCALHHEDPNDNGCNAGNLVQMVENYVAPNGGLNSDRDYPYDSAQKSGGKKNPCKFDKTKIAGTASTWHLVEPRKDEAVLKNAVTQIGPLATIIDASLRSFQTYSSGIYDDPHCESDEMGGHMVTLVGYGTDTSSGLDYWIINNSWGEDWGEGGYIRIARNKGNVCGVANEVTYALV